MRQLKTIVIAIILIGQSCSGTDKFKTVLKSPDKFHDQEVEVTGIFHDQFEDHAIYLTTDSEKDKAIWVNFSQLFLSLNSFSGLGGQKLRVIGTFNINDKGHLGQYAGSLDEARIIKME